MATTNSKRQRGGRKSSKTEVEKIRAALKSELYGINGELVGNTKKAEDLVEGLLKTTGLSRTKHTIRDNLQKMPTPAGCKLTGNLKSGYSYRWTEHHVFSERERHRPHTKSRLGEAIWHFLFGIESKAQYEFHGGIEQRRIVLNKTASLRRKSPVHLFFDAGSTTIKCCEKLLVAPRIPLEIKATDHAENDDEAAKQGGSAEEITNYRLVSPHLMTNCPKIATIVGDSRFRDDVPVVLIGGEQRSQRGSICGTLAQMWIQQFQPSVDVSIIGSTGCRYDREGRVAFGSDNVEEAQIKSTFLSPPHSWLRIIVLDSSKLSLSLLPGIDSVTSSQVARKFATASPENVDLIVTDDGAGNKTYEDAFTEFRENLHPDCCYLVVKEGDEKGP
jgi:hypothetical protein